VYAQAAQQRCANENDPVNESANARRHVRLQACTQRPRWSLNATLRSVVDTCKLLSVADISRDDGRRHGRGRAA